MRFYCAASSAYYGKVSRHDSFQQSFRYAILGDDFVLAVSKHIVVIEVVSHASVGYNSTEANLHSLIRFSVETG
jgi:hypothetical protein